MDKRGTLQKDMNHKFEITNMQMKHNMEMNEMKCKLNFLEAKEKDTNCLLLYSIGGGSVYISSLL
jgi:hypothetical protein